MNFFKGLNKEQWTALVTIALSALMLLSGFSGGVAPGAETMKMGAEEPYAAQKARYVELPNETFVYGRNVFGIESAVKLAVPVIKAPEPRDEEMPAPAFRPGPAWELYNRLNAPVKYPTLSLGAPAIAEANLPAASEVADLCKLQEPPPEVKTDRRGEQERAFALIKMKAGGQIIEAIKAEMVGDWVVGKRKNGTTLRIPRADVDSIQQNRTNEEQYKFDSENLRPGPKEAEDRFKLAQRCLELGMIPEAKEEQLVEAVPWRGFNAQPPVVAPRSFVARARLSANWAAPR